MIKLNDYLGSIVASFTNAKIMSDLQTVKLAEEYAKHDYLKHFSIPRMRIDDVEMTIPIALDEAVRTGQIKTGDTVVTSGFGAGLTWGAAIFKWG